MKKLITVSILVCLIFVLVYTTALAEADIVINPFHYPNEYHVSPEDTIILDGGWAACRRGAVQMFLTASNIHWVLFGPGTIIASGIDTSQYWGPIHQIPGQTDACMGQPPEMLWSTRWNYTLGQLEPGEYALFFRLWLDHPVTDVADYDGDGRPDLFDGIISYKVYRIVVEE